MPAEIVAARIPGPNISFGMSKHIPSVGASSATSAKSHSRGKTSYVVTSRTMRTTLPQSAAVSRRHQDWAVYRKLVDLAQLPE